MTPARQTPTVKLSERPPSLGRRFLFPKPPEFSMRYLPFVLAVVVLAGFTAYQGILTDRWRENVEAAECAKLLDQIPKEIGDWVGTDQEVDDNIRKTAGAEGYVSRSYVNSNTKEVVNVWFIVGHSFNIARHTPNICYRAQGFSQMAPEENYSYNFAEGETAGFLTAAFKGQQGINRVFWTWSKPVAEPGEKIEWIAPDNRRRGWFAPKDPRGTFGNMRALYKLYFTTAARSEDEKPEDSVCLKFAQEFLPVAGQILGKAVNAPATEAAPVTESTETPAAG